MKRYTIIRWSRILAPNKAKHEKSDYGIILRSRVHSISSPPGMRGRNEKGAKATPAELPKGKYVSRLVTSLRPAPFPARRLLGEHLATW